MAKKGETIQKIWKNKGPLTAGLLAGILAGGVFEAANTPPAPPQEVFSCTLKGIQALCPDGDVLLSKERIKIVSGGETNSVSRDRKTGNGTLATATKVFTVLGRGPGTQVFEINKP